MGLDVARSDFSRRNAQSYHGDERELEGIASVEMSTVTFELEVCFPIRMTWVKASELAIYDASVAGLNGEDLTKVLLYQAPCGGSNRFVDLGTEQAEGEVCWPPATVQ